MATTKSDMEPRRKWWLPVKKREAIPAALLSVTRHEVVAAAVPVVLVRDATGWSCEVRGQVVSSHNRWALVELVRAALEAP